MRSPVETCSYRAPVGYSGAIQRLVDEASMLAQALLQPGKLIAEVEQMHALRVEADRIEATHPVRAGTLRRQAAQLGLR